MNYLAHAFLSPEDPLILAGNLWGDLIRPKDYDALLPGLLDGIILHKKIDAFTDQHRGVDEIVKLIRPYQGKYTPVVADVLMDFILSKFWHMFHEKTIEDFCEHKYKQIAEHLHLIPLRLHPRINRMLENNWLESCKNREQIKRTLYMLSNRASFENKMAEAMQPYDLHEHTMDRLFLTFFDDMRAYLILRSEG